MAKCLTNKKRKVVEAFWVEFPIPENMPFWTSTQTNMGESVE